MLCITFQLVASDSDNQEGEEEEEDDEENNDQEDNQERMFTDDPNKKSSYINLPSTANETDPPSPPEKTAGRPNMNNK